MEAEDTASCLRLEIRVCVYHLSFTLHACVSRFALQNDGARLTGVAVLHACRSAFRLTHRLINGIFSSSRSSNSKGEYAFMDLG